MYTTRKMKTRDFVRTRPDILRMGEKAIVKKFATSRWGDAGSIVRSAGQ